MILGIFIGVIIGVFIGVIIGVLLMCIIQISRIDEAVTTVKQCESALEHERTTAILEHKDMQYINGMSRMIGLFKIFFEEELIK